MSHWMMVEHLDSSLYLMWEWNLLTWVRSLWIFAASEWVFLGIVAGQCHMRNSTVDFMWIRLLSVIVEQAVYLHQHC